MSTERLYDVIVVGAGLSGLSASQQLLLAGKDVLVLEAGMQAGGKIESKLVEDLVLDLGAQWISPGYEQVLQLCELLGLQVEKKEFPGKNFYATNGIRKYFTGMIPTHKISDRLNASRLLSGLEKTRIPDPEKPWLGSDANKLDKLRFGHYIKQKTYSSNYSEMIRNIVESRFLNGINQVSALEAINNWKAGSNGDKWVIVGGMDQLVRKLTQEVDIHYQQPVTSVIQEGRLLKIKTLNRNYRCRSAIIAIPPLQAAGINYIPAVSGGKEKLWNSIEGGRIIKSLLVFESQAWKKGLWSGQGFFNEDYAFNALFDIGTAGQARDILCTYTIGDRCRKLEGLTEAEKKELILHQVKSILQMPTDTQVRHFLIRDWKTPPNGPGAYHIFPPGTLTDYAAYIDQREGQIYWAAAEYDHLFRGTLEGAVRSGRKAADAILGI
ncbi:MAG: FAD-dependent oxidoreductase [Saprospiraceae bacterium]|nr:FAD-dependent oxidoreductase [Saprospiraceae bacterium]